MCVYKRATQDFFIINSIKQTIMKKNIFKTLAVTVLSAVSLTAWAVDPYAGLVNTTTEITFDGKAWYLIEDNSTAANAGTVTLLSQECVGKSVYNSSGSFVTYDNNPTVKEVVDTWYSSNITENSKTAVADNKAFILESINGINADVLKCNPVGGTYSNLWWLCSKGTSDTRAKCVDGDVGYLDDRPASWEQSVRPAIKVDLSKIEFNTETNTFGPAAATSVATPTLSPADAAKSNIWYDLNGRHYQGKPTMQGVYINNHQKYVVK